MKGLFVLVGGALVLPLVLAAVLLAAPKTLPKDSIYLTQPQKWVCVPYEVKGEPGTQFSCVPAAKVRDFILQQVVSPCNSQ